MSVGKSSISRMSASAETEKKATKPVSGIVSKAPEVPEGDAAPIAVKTVTESAPEAAKASAEKPAPKKKPAKKEVAPKFGIVQIGEELPIYLL